MNLPPIVSHNEWQAAHDEFLKKEKESTRALDALAAARRRLPRLRIEKDYTFQGPDGPVSLADLFQGRSQLILYHFMFAPDVRGWPSSGCPGCSMVVDNVGNLAHLHQRDTSFVLVSRAPYLNLREYQERMEWSIPWFSSEGSSFNEDFGVTTPEGETFRMSILLQTEDGIYVTYYTNGRGVEHLGSFWTLLDLTPLGRQESWEDSPADYPQTAPFEWWERHDEYPKS